jgi:hypothetical protein
MDKKSAALLKAIVSGTVADIAKVLESGVSPNRAVPKVSGEPIDFRESPLVTAVLTGDPERVKLLLDSGADSYDLDGDPLDLDAGRVDNALHYLIDDWDAIAPNAQVLGEMLLSHGIDIGAWDSAGYTALHRAVIGNNEIACRFLLENGADPTALSDAEGRLTPVDEAAELGWLPILEVLMHACADPAAGQPRRFTPLHQVAKCGNWDPMLLSLLRIGADINACDFRGLRALDFLTRSGEENLRPLFAYIAVGARPTRKMLETFVEKSLIGFALRAHRFVAAAICGSGEIMKNVMSEFPKTAGPEDIQMAAFAATLAKGELLDELLRWQAAHEANEVVIELRASGELPSADAMTVG